MRRERGKERRKRGEKKEEKREREEEREKREQTLGQDDDPVVYLRRFLIAAVSKAVLLQTEKEFCTEEISH
jgi:hypothetical protein